MSERAGEPARARQVRRRRLMVVAALALVAAGLAAGVLWLVRGRDGDDLPSVDGGDTGQRADAGADDDGATTSTAGTGAGPPDQAALDGLELGLEPVAEIEHPTAVREGTTPGLDGAPPGLVEPALAYTHEGRCGVTGGAVYRGEAIPTLAGAYLYSDLCDGIVRAVAVSGGRVVAERSFESAQAGYPVSFGTDLAGEMYLCSFDLNIVFRLVAA